MKNSNAQRRWLAAITACVGLATAGSHTAHAQETVTFSYTGAAFNQAKCADWYSGYADLCATSGNVTGQITFPVSAISAGLATAAIVPASGGSYYTETSTIASFSFSANGNVVTEADRCFRGRFEFAQGQISKWVLEMYDRNGCETYTTSPYRYIGISSQPFFNFSGPYDATHSQPTVSPNPLINAAAAASPGTWTIMSAPPPTSCVGSATAVGGTATVLHNNGTQEPITANTQVCMADVIETDQTAEVSIRFDDGSDFDVSPNSRLEIDEYVYDASAGSGPADFSKLRRFLIWTSEQVGREQGEIIRAYGSLGWRGDASDYLDKDILDRAVLMYVGSPVSLVAPVPIANTASELSFDLAFLTATGQLNVLLGDTVLYSTSANEHHVGRFERITIPVPAIPIAPHVVPVEVAHVPAEMFSKSLVLIPSDYGTPIGRLTFRFDGATGSQLVLDSIVFPGLANGEFGQFDEGWFWEGPGRIDLVATIREERWAELIQELDSDPPLVSCALPDGIWHNANVSLACTAQDDGAGLANNADASFALVTNIAAGVETANAVSNSRSVCDKANNCTFAGPVAGNMVDRKAPVISIMSPASDERFTLGQSVGADYACADAGSGVVSCIGSVAPGMAVDTSAVGSYNFVVSTVDSVGNTANVTASHVVSYGVCPEFDQDKVVQAGATVPIRLGLCDASGADVSSGSIAVTAISLRRVSSDSSGPVEGAGSANPDQNFRYAGDRYVFNLSTKGLVPGTYRLSFTAGLDPQIHDVLFKVR